MNFSSLQKPSRYINREINAIYRDAPVKVALAFPDIYEIGMSHLGLRILYKIINDLSYASAERIFSPWIDLEEEMRANGLPLTSLESNRPLSDFDIVGFSLQYELSYTTVLNMLYLGGIPLRSSERMDIGFPLVIAGGPCTVNPAPMSPFIDAFLIGDGEEAIKKAETGDYDLILMDIELPGMDGVEVTKIIKTRDKNLPVVALTSYAMKGDRERFMKAGFDEYMSKPLDVSEFIKRLDKYRKQ